MHWWRLLPAVAVIAFIVWAGIKMTRKEVQWQQFKRDYWESE